MSMSLPHLFYTAEWVATLAVNITILYVVFPAYKKTKRPSLLWVGYGYLIGTFDIVFYHTVIVNLPPVTRAMILPFQYCAAIACELIACAGWVALICSFVALHFQHVGPPSDPEVSRINVPSFMRNLIRKLGE